MMRMFGKYGIDIRKEPILVYPTLHYQNGGIDISADGMSGVENLYVAGRNAGRRAGEKCKNVKVKKLTLDFVKEYERALETAGLRPEMPSPRLLPDYRRKDN